MWHFLRIGLASWYLLMGAGLSVQAHFCMGRLESLSFFAEKADPCAETCLLFCCYDLSQELRLEAEHVAAEMQAVQPVLALPALPQPAAWRLLRVQPQVPALPQPDEGPPLPRAPRYLLHHSLVYYG